MAADRKRLARLVSLKRLRTVEARLAAMEVAEARNAHYRMQELHHRSEGLVQEYSARMEAADGAALHAQLGFIAGLSELVGKTGPETRKAEGIALDSIQRLSLANRRQEASESRIDSERRAANHARLMRDGATYSGLARKLKSR